MTEERLEAPRSVLIVTGAPGSGKTTVAALLARTRERAVHIESDSFFHVVKSGFIEPWRPASHQQNTVVMDAVAKAAGAYAAGGYFTVVDGIISPGWFFEPLSRSLASGGHAVAYVILRPPLAVALERARHRKARALVDPAPIEQLWRDFADVGPLERHVLDNSELTPEETAAEVDRRLASGALDVGAAAGGAASSIDRRGG